MLERLRQNPFWWYQGPMVVWATLLFILSSIPGTEIPALWVFGYDKVIHFLLYVVLAWTVYRAIVHQEWNVTLKKHPYIFTILIVALYGATDEWHQLFVPKRSCSLYDWFADCIGAMTVCAAYWLRAKLKSTFAAV